MAGYLHARRCTAVKTKRSPPSTYSFQALQTLVQPHVRSSESTGTIRPLPRRCSRTSSPFGRGSHPADRPPHLIPPAYPHSEARRLPGPRSFVRNRQLADMTAGHYSAALSPRPGI